MNRTGPPIAGFYRDGQCARGRVSNVT